MLDLLSYRLEGYALVAYLGASVALVGALWVVATVSLAREEARSRRLQARIGVWL